MPLENYPTDYGSFLEEQESVREIIELNDYVLISRYYSNLIKEIKLYNQ